MAGAFDPYHKWLGISPEEQPANHYRLLAIREFESDPEVIESAADRQMAHVRSFQTGPHSAHSQRLLNELSAARLCLLTPAKKAAYDKQLQRLLAALNSADGAGRPSEAAPASAASGGGRQCRGVVGTSSPRRPRPPDGFSRLWPSRNPGRVRWSPRW